MLHFLEYSKNRIYPYTLLHFLQLWNIKRSCYLKIDFLKEPGQCPETLREIVYKHVLWFYKHVLWFYKHVPGTVVSTYEDNIFPWWNLSPPPPRPNCSLRMFQSKELQKSISPPPLRGNFEINWFDEGKNSGLTMPGPSPHYTLLILQKQKKKNNIFFGRSNTLATKNIERS